jgi:uncharacterized protein (DUF362 family)
MEEKGGLPNGKLHIIRQCRRGSSGARISSEGEALGIHTLLYGLLSFRANRPSCTPPLWKHAAGLQHVLCEGRVQFIDLNRDEVQTVRLKAHYSGLRELWLPHCVLASNIIVSMPKVKTHHWAGVTLSLKNMFGIVPGMKYGWPKNLLHWAGIHESVLDICATVPIHFVIADGITAMEGNGPLQGTARELGKLVLADDPVTADATCARLMGFNPVRVGHIRMAGDFLGNLDARAIVVVGDRTPLPRRPFAVLPGFSYLLHRSS